MDYMSVKEAAELWNASECRIQKLCEEGLIDAVNRIDLLWIIS